MKQFFVTAAPTLKRGVKHICQIDNFLGSDIFFSNGKEIRDVDVFANASTSPELREKLNSYMIENDIRGFDDSVSNEDVEKAIVSKYDNRQSLLAKISSRISELRSKESSVEK